MFHHRFAPAENLVKPCEQPYRESVCLNGSWQFQPIAVPSDFARGTGRAPDLPLPQAEYWAHEPLRVPSPWNVNSFADRNGQGGDFNCFPSYPEAWKQAEMGWLRRKFDVPANWKGRRVALHFEAVTGEAVILVNGTPIARHFDIFLPFTAEISNSLVYGGSNELLVGVRKASLFDNRGKYGRRPYQGGSFWGQHAAGIWQDVFLVATAEVHVANVQILPDLEQNRLQVRATVRNQSAQSVDLELGGEVFEWLGPRAGRAAAEPRTELGAQRELMLGAEKRTIAAGEEAVLTLVARVPQTLASWTPEAPHLHGLVLTARSGGATVDVKYERFGWRQFTVHGAELRLNGKPLVLKGDSWHFMGIPQMTRRYACAWYTALQEAGLNAVRLHAQPYPSFYLDVADEMGILVLDETAIWASDAGPKLDDPAFWQDAGRHLEALVLRDRNHPSVFGWSICNEMRPIVRSVLRNPTGMMDELIRHYQLWLESCHRLDPTRGWVSADGDEDGDGVLPVFLVHYGGTGDMRRAVASGKPWGVGETGNAYYATPEQVAETNGERAYESFEGRMEGVAIASYRCLMDERAYGASYRSVFNLVWYGLQPLPFGLRDESRPPAMEDGVFFPPFVEGQPGVQPERLGPYCSTLNPGYDAALPLLRKWPLFTAIQEAVAEPPIAGRWSKQPALTSPEAPAVVHPMTSAAVRGGAGSTLGVQLRNLGVTLIDFAASHPPMLLFVDGTHPPAAEARAQVESVCRQGGTVVVWGADSATLSRLNALLPAPLAVETRTASSLLPRAASDVTAGLVPSALYFSAEQPAQIVTRSLDGPLVRKGTVLLEDCTTDWTRWNGQPEYAKTAMVFRSEQEAKPSGVVLVEYAEGAGRILATTLPLAPANMRAEKLLRRMLANLGLHLESGIQAGNALLKTGALVRALSCALSPKAPAEIWRGNGFRTDARLESSTWQPVFDADGSLPLSGGRSDAGDEGAAVYVSFWIWSPRSLVDLLIEPDLPQLDLHLFHAGPVQFWLNDQPQKPSSTNARGAVYEGLRLQQHWNHLLFRVESSPHARKLEVRVAANQPDFLAALDSAVERP